ncbi:MAG: methyltransferase domain-containing protein [Pseudomonadota bacterium]
MDWDEMARPWLEAADDLELCLKPVQDALMAAAALQPGERVLDIGCGTGPGLLAAHAAVGPEGKVLGVDIAPPLVARAQERVPDTVEVVVGDAESHPIADAGFDVVISNFGTMFFDDTEAAFLNLRQAVGGAGRLAATVWGPPYANPYFIKPREIVDSIVPDVPRPDPTGPGPMRFGDPVPLLGMTTAAGWAPEIKTVDLHLTPPGPPEQVAALHMKVTAGMMLRGVEVTDAQLAAVEAALVAMCADAAQNGVITFPAQIHVVTATAA